MIARLVLLIALALAVPAAAQTRRGAPPPPKLTGIDLARAEFLAASGGDTVYFGGSSAALGLPAKALLQRQAAWLRRNPSVVVAIEGHADASDTRDRALAISARRGSARLSDPVRGAPGAADRDRLGQGTRAYGRHVGGGAGRQPPGPDRSGALGGAALAAGCGEPSAGLALRLGNLARGHFERDVGAAFLALA